MSWLLLLGGLALTGLGATVATAYMLASRQALTRAVAQRLRGGDEAAPDLAQLERELAAAGATTSLGVVLTAAGAPGLASAAGPLAAAAVVLFVGAPLLVLVGLVLPRRLTEASAAGWLARLRPVLGVWTRAVGALLPAIPGDRETAIRALRREETARRLAEPEELRTADGVVTFTRRPVREVMTPRTAIVAVAETASREEVAGVFAESGFSRIPVYRGTLDELVGMLHAFDLFKLAPGSPLPIRPVAVAPASRPCGDLLVDMQRERRHLAVIIDEFGGTLGIATLEDLLEELVGEITDEDTPPAGEAQPASPVVEAEGTLEVAVLEERLGVTLPPGRAASVGGRLAELAGRIPAAGERLTVGGVEVLVLDASPARIERLAARLASAPSTTLGERQP